MNKRDYTCFEGNTAKNNENRISEAFKYFQPEKEGFYTKIVPRFLANPAFLKLAYMLIKKTECASVFGKNPYKSAFVGFSMDLFKKMALDIKRGIYQIKANRSISVLIKKTFKTKLFVASDFKSNILKKAIQLVLEEIYERKEKKFSRFSHGFCLNKSSQTAFKQIKNE
jgi:hypothetical protein